MTDPRKEAEALCEVCGREEDAVYMVGGLLPGKCSRRRTPDWHKGAVECYRLGYERLRAQLAEKEKAVAKAAALRTNDRLAAYAGSVVAEEIIGFLEAAGCGKPGTPNTVWAMVQEIIARAATAQQRIEALEGALEQLVEEIAPADFSEACLICGGREPDCCTEIQTARAALAPSATATQTRRCEKHGAADVGNGRFFECGCPATATQPAQENKLLGKEGRCDWWGHDGESGQCPSYETTMTGNRLLCTEHLSVVLRGSAPATAQPAIDTDLPDSEGRGRVKQTCVRCQGRGLRTAPPGGSMRCDECEGRGWMWHPAAAVPPSREAAVQERGQLCVLRRRSAEASRAYLEGTISALAGVEVLASTLPKKDVRDYCHKEAERLRLALALAETSDSASPREASATAASPDKE